MEQKARRYNDAEKLQFIDEFMNSGESMETFQVKYGMGHSTLSRWMIRFGLSNKPRKHKLLMKKAKVVQQSPDKTIRERALEAQVSQLQQELEDEKLKSMAYSTMIDVAEEELGIVIRKNLVPNSE